MPISSFYRQKESTAKKPWNSTRIAGARRGRKMSAPVSLHGTWATGGNTNMGAKTLRRFPYKLAKGTGSETRDRRGRATTAPSPAKLIRELPERHGSAPVRNFARCKSDSLIVRHKMTRELSANGEQELHVNNRERSEAYSRLVKEKTLQKRNRKTGKVDTEIPIPAQNNSNTHSTGHHKTLPRIGERVVCVLNRKPRTGVLHYLGTTHFSPGEWCGIVLEEPCGKNDGEVKGVRYFTCGENYGIFVHSHKVRVLDEVSLRLTIAETDGLVIQNNTTVEQKRSLNTKMESIGVQNIAVTNVNLRKWPAHCSKDTFTRPRPRSFSSGMKFGLNLEPSMQDNTNCLELDLADLSRSVSFPKISSKQMFLVSAEGIKDITKTADNNDANGGSKRGSCPNLAKLTTEDICLPELNNGPEIAQCNEPRQEDCVPNACQQNGSDYSEQVTSSRTSDAVQKQFWGIKKLERSQSCEDLSKRKLSSSVQPAITVAHASLEKQSTIDPFVQGKYCSCPSLVPSQHLSGAIEACLDLGREDYHSGRSSSKNVPLDEEHVLSKASASSSSTAMDGHISSSSAVNLANIGRSNSTSKLAKRASLTDDRQMGRLLGEVMHVSTIERSNSWPCMGSMRSSFDSMVGVRPVLLIEEFSYGGNNIHDDLSIIDDDTETLSCSDSVHESEILGPKSDTTAKNISSVANMRVKKSGRNNSPSLTNSQASISSSGTNESQGPIRKGTKPKPTATKMKRPMTKVSRDSTLKQNSSKNVKNTEESSLVSQRGAPPRITKRNTVSALQQIKLDFSKTSRPFINHRPSSTLSEPDQTKQKRKPELAHRLSTSPNSKLPMIRRTSQPPTSKPGVTPTKTDKPPTKGVASASRPAAQPSVKRVGSFTSTAEKQKRELSSGSSPSLMRNNSSKRKVSAPVSATQRPNAGRVAMGTKGPGGVTRVKPSVTRTAADKKKLSETSTTVVPSKPKSTSTATKQSPSAKPPGPASRIHHPSRLPRKISRDPSTESAQSHDWDHESTTSDYDDRRLSRQDSFPYDADRSDFESSTRSWHAPQAPDILTGVTRESRQRSVEVQVEIDDDQAVQDMHDKLEKLDEMLAGKTKQCQELEKRLADGENAFLASAILLVIFHKQLRGSSRHINHITRELEMTDEDLRHNVERLREEEANSVKLQEEMMYVRSEHKVAIETLKADHENSVDALKYTMKRQQMEELTLAAQEHVEELNKLEEKHQNQLSEVQSAHAKAIANLHEQHKDEVVEVESKHSSHVDELLEEHQVEVETIKQDYEEQRSALETKLFSVTSECTSLNIKLQRLQEETEKDIESRIQDAIEKYKRLPEELESMKAVLEMKNDEIKQLRMGVMETKMELDHLRKLAARLRKLEQENESLSFVVENKSKFERQLSVERESLKTSLEKESAKSKRLSLENEELQWRLFNSPSPGAEPLESPKLNSRNSYRLSASFSDADPISE